MIDPEMDLGGLDAIAVVDKPAIELKYQLFEDEDIEMLILENLMRFEFESKFKTIFLISCSQGKLSSAAPASEIYTSPLFQKSLSYARKKGPDENIKILSAKYELIDLDQVIEPYDMTLKDFAADDAKAWADNVYNQMVEKFDIQNDRFVFLAGGAYTKYLIDKFQYTEDLLAGKRIGERMQYLGQFRIFSNNEIGAKFHSFEDYYEVKTQSFAEQMDEQQIIASPIMIADKMIPRVNDETGEMYEVYFEAEDIKNLSYKLMKDKLIDSINFNHDASDTTTNITLVESWLVEDPSNDKSNLFGYQLNKGDWFGLFKVFDKKEWLRIKTGDFNGVSVQGAFIEKLMKMV
jgi:hypothetical protein